MPRLPAVLAAMLVLACSSTKSEGGSDKAAGPKQEERACPSIYIEPQARIDLGDGAMRRNGSYAVEFEADDQREACVIEVSDMSPAVEDSGAVRSPTTRTTTTCKLVAVAGTQDDGSVRYLRTVGTPKLLSLKLSRDGEILTMGSARPSYAPDECNFVKPVVTLSK